MIFEPFSDMGEVLYKDTLPNGLQLRIVPKPGFSKIYAFMGVNYGSIDSTFTIDGITKTTPQGVAHYLEHKMFDMPEGNVMQDFASLGGYPNAFTSYDMTAFYVECTEHFEKNLKILLNYVTTPYFTEESVQKEQGIIAQEIRMYEDSADSRVFENLYAALFASHPIRNNIAGTVESIAEITHQTLYDCYHAFYTPENMMLCIVGDVNPENTRAIIEKSMQAASASFVPVREYGLPETLFPAQKRIEQDMEVSMPMFAIGFKTECPSDGVLCAKEELIGELATEIIIGESTDLYKRLYEANLIDSGFSAGYESMRNVSLVSICGDSVDPDAVYQAILEEADRVRREGIDDETFQILKNSAYGRRIRDLDGFEGICYRMCAYHFQDFEYFKLPALFQSINKDQVMKFLTRTFTEERSAISIIWPNH